MPKSRNRGRGQTRPIQRRTTFSRWNKWLAAIPLIALLLATLIGLFAAQPVLGGPH